MKRLPALVGAPTSATFPLAGSHARNLPWHLLWRLAICLVGAWLCCCALGAYVAWTLTHPARKVLDVTPTVPYNDVQFASAQDHLNLYGWFLDAGSDKTVIMLHGYRDNRTQGKVPALDVGEGLVAQGYNFLTFDMRDSGESEGSMSTIGVDETRDAEGAIDYIRSLGAPGRHIALLGYSMGAATALLTGPAEPGVQAIIADSSFADLYPYLVDSLPVWSHLPSFPFTPLILSLEPAITGVDPRLADPLAAVPQIKAPILFIHGLADTQIPYSNSQELAAAARNPADQLWLVPGADHTKAFATDPQAYWGHVLPFLASALK